MLIAFITYKEDMIVIIAVKYIKVHYYITILFYLFQSHLANIFLLFLYPAYLSYVLTIMKSILCCMRGLLK